MITEYEVQCPHCRIWLPLVIHGEPSEQPNAVRIVIGFQHPSADCAGAKPADEEFQAAVINSIRLRLNR